MLYYTQKVFKESFLTDYLIVLENYQDTSLMDYYGLCSKERKKWKISFQMRLDNDDVCGDIMCDFTEVDMRKIEISKNIFA